MFKAEKRFIAGAVCPRCGQQDKLVMFVADDNTYRECVACDFRELLQFENPVRELDTRVNRSAEAKLAETRPVRFLE